MASTLIMALVELRRVHKTKEAPPAGSAPRVAGNAESRLCGAAVSALVVKGFRIPCSTDSSTNKVDSRQNRWRPAEIGENVAMGQLKLTDFEVGEVVLYIPSHADSHLSQAEKGIVTSINEYYVFVRYGSALHSNATRPEDLRKYS